jgi:hypothetical protein
MVTFWLNAYTPRVLCVRVWYESDKNSTRRSLNISFQRKSLNIERMRTTGRKMHGFVHRPDARPNKRASLSLARGAERAPGPACRAPRGGRRGANGRTWLRPSAPVPCACGFGKNSSVAETAGCAVICVFIVTVSSAMLHSWRLWQGEAHG